MDYLSRYMVIGLILLSSLSAFAEDGAPVNDNKKDSAAVPIGDIGKVLDKSDEVGPGRNAGTEAQAGEGLPGSQENVNKIPQTVEAPLLKCAPAQKAAEPSLTKIKNGVKMFNENYDNCKTREAKANQFCLESRNPDIKNFIAVAQVLVGGLSGMMDACSKFGKVMDAGNKALTAYQGLCSSWRGYCNSACGDAVKGLNMIQAGQKEIVPAVTKVAQAEAAKGPTNPLSVPCGQVASTYAKEVESTTEPITKELKADATDYRPVAQKYSTCKSYARELASAGVGLIGMLNSFGQANKCEKDTKSDNPTATAGSTAVDCTIPENKKNKMECICQDNPRMAGCNTGLDSATMAKSGDGLRAAGGGDYTNADGKAPGNLDLGGGDGQDLQAKATDGSGGSSLPGAPSGGGGGLGGGSGGFGGGVEGTTAKKPSSLNTNILGGEGGGGGGGGWGGYGSDRDPALRQYLPGGAKDPNAAGMAGAAISKQVTSQGGKSNWEKVKDRYRDNKPTLLGY